ncbi:MAG: pyridoxamine 5'-phosphate oxidase family protein [Bacteroidales bacterium]|nr:pyridoxamine 5'-phosphate oxidase family protein [Bacteroidales bacterium]
MRKQSREMPAEWALEVLDKAPFITLSMTDSDGSPYAVPLSMARTDERTFYFHGALEGRKMEVLDRNPKVCLSAVTRCRPVVGPKDNSFTLEFKSAIAFGTAEMVTDREEKILGLKAVCQRFLPQHMGAFEAAVERSIERTAVMKVTLSEPPTGKRKQYDSQGEEMKYGRME